MSAADRAFGWDLLDLALFPDGPTAPGTGDTSLFDLLTLFTACSLRQGMETVEGRATAEVYSAPLYVSENWSVEVGAVVEKGFATLASLRITNGPGPYWARLRNTDMGYVGKVLIQDARLGIPDGAQEQGATLIGYGALTQET